MASKTIYVDTYELGALSALKGVLQLRGASNQLPAIDAELAFYTAMFSSGAERFSIPEADSVETPRSKFWSDRIQRVDPVEVLRVSGLVGRAFGAGAVDDDLKKLNNLVRAKVFLSELLLAARRKESCAVVAAMPQDITNTPGVPFELGIAISGLLSEFQPERVDSVVPRLVADRSAVERLETILASDAFTSYSATQLALEDATYESEGALRSVARAGKELVNRYEQTVAPASIGVSLLNVTTKVVDVVCGKFVGALAEFVAKALESALKDRRRLVLYRFDGMFQSLLEKRVQDLIEAEQAER